MGLDRRSFLLIGGSSLVATIFGCGPCANYKNSLTFNNAKEDKRFRENYLEKVSKGLEDLEFFDGLVYDLSGEKEVDYVAKIMLHRDKRLTPEIAKRTAKNYLKDDPTARVPQIFTEYGLGNKSPIFVRDSVFEKDFILNENDLLFVLREHEYIHAENQANGLQIGYYEINARTALDMVSGKVEPALLTAFVELRALKNQVDKLENKKYKGISEEMIKFVKDEYQKNVLAVKDYIPNNNLNSYLKNQILESFLVKA